MNNHFTELRPYQRACIIKMQNDITEGKKRLYVNMPIGTGKLITIIEFLHTTMKDNEKVLYLGRMYVLVEQAKDILMQKLDSKQVTCSLISDLGTHMSLEGFQFIIYDIDDFHNDKRLIRHILDNYNGITIGLYSGSPDNMELFFKNRGEISYSLKYSEDCIKYAIQNFNIVQNITSSIYEEVQDEKINTKSVDKIIKNDKMHSLICNTLCIKSIDAVKTQEAIIDIVSLIAGLIPGIGSFIGLSTKYLFKWLCKYITNQLSHTLKCIECKA